MKKVNIKPTCPVHGAFGLPLVTPLNNHNATEDQIYRCLLAGAYVEEILPNGNKVELSFRNYNKDNGGKLDIKPPVINKPQPEIEVPAMKIDPSGQPNKSEEKKPKLRGLHPDVTMYDEVPSTLNPLEEDDDEEEIQEESEVVEEEQQEEDTANESTINVGQPQQRQGGRPHNSKNKK